MSLTIYRARMSRDARTRRSAILFEAAAVAATLALIAGLAAAFSAVFHV